MKRQTRRMKDLAKRGLVGLLTVSMCLSNVQGIAFADNRVEVGGVKVDGKKVTLNLNGGSLMEAARAALADANVYDDTYIAVSKDAKTQAAYRALTDGSNPLYELALFSDGELQALEGAGVEIVALIQMDQKQAEAAGNLAPATASEIERTSTKVEFFDPSKDEGKEILLYQPDSLFAGFYDQFSNQLMNASEKEIADADPTTYELSGDEKVTFLFINHADAGRTFNLELNGKSLEKGIKVAKAESVIKDVMSTLDVSGIDETLETPAPEISAAVTEPSTEAAVQPTDEAATEPSTETAIEPSTEASGNAGESTVILPETGATAESGEIETSAATETSAVAAQPTEAEANAETGLPAEGQTSTENTEQPAAEKTAAAAENTGIVDTVKEVIETIAENANATMMKIERRLGVIRAEAAESDEAVVEAPKAEDAPKAENADEAPKAENAGEAPKTEGAPAAGTENEAPKAENTDEAPKTEEMPTAGTENEAPNPEETPAAGSENEAPKPEENPAAGTGIETPNPEETPAAGTGIEAPKTEETTTAAEIETTAAVKTDMDIALENDRKALLRETRAADLVDSSVASARVLQYTLDDLSKSFWSAEITDRYEVNVFAEDNAFIESVKLELKELEKPEEAEDGSLAVNEDTLNEKQVEALKADGVYENSQSLDIRFVNAAGEEVEPSSAVKVRIKVYKEALPEDADISTMAIRHLDEKSTDAVNVDTVAEYREDATSDHGTIKPVDGDGKVTELQSVDADNAGTETAAIAETATESKKVLPEEAVAVESTFTVNSFSSFTITFGTNNSAKVIFVDTNRSEIGTNAIINLSTISADETSELDLSKYAADFVRKYNYWGQEEWEKQNYTFNHVELDRGSKTKNPIHNKLKVITDESGEKKWQYSYTEGTGEGAEIITDFIQNRDTIYVVYSSGIALTTVNTVNSKDLGFHLYMTNYDNAAAIGGGYYDTNDGSITQGVYSSSIEEGKEYPTLGDKSSNKGTSISKWFPRTREVNHLFLQSVYDETGYFYYNSAENFATLKNDNDDDFTVYNQLGSPAGSEAYYYQRGNFMPYNTLNTGYVINRNLYDDQGTALATSDPRYKEALYGFNETKQEWSDYHHRYVPVQDNDFYFGMYGWAEFYQPVNGKVKDDDMIFEFTGDDDMVVYIDGALVLDLGGIHDAQSGYINFATGEVGYTDHETDTKVEWKYTTIKSQYNKAQKSTNWKTIEVTKADGTKERREVFADGTNHKLQMFYMERGAGASNLKIKVNIPPIPDGSVNIQKKVVGLNPAQAKKEEYTLQLLTKTGDQSWQPAANQLYKVNGQDAPPTGDNGEFTIHAGEVAVFSQIPANTEVKVVELNKGQIYEVSYQAYDSTGKALTNGKNATVTSAGHVRVEVTNNAEKATKSLEVVKKFLVNGAETRNAPDTDIDTGKSEFDNANFILQEKQSDGTYVNLSAENHYSSFPNTTGNSKSLTFTQLDPTKTYRVVEEITEATDGGDSTTPYTRTSYKIGSDISSTDCLKDITSKPGTTLLASGDITLQKEESGEYTYHNNTVTFINEYNSPSVNVEFTKVDVADKTQKLAGAVFALYTDAKASTAYPSEDAPVTATSGEDGVVKFENLPYKTDGTTVYYIKETKAPDGYVLSDTVYTVAIAADGKVTITGAGAETKEAQTTITNTPTQIKFVKMDANDDTKSIEATFEIKKGGEILTGIDGIDAYGQFKVSSAGTTLAHLPDGTYQLTEITAPGGYNLLTKKIEFTITNGQLSGKDEKNVVKFDSTAKTVTIYNTAGIALPETGGMGTLMTTMSGMALMLIALGYLILVKRREKGGLN